MTAEERAQLRLLLGEVVPPNGTDADTMFTDDEIEAIYAQAGDDLNAAALEGWRLKAAQYASLVDVSEAGESMKLGQLQGAALKMVEHYEELTTGALSGRTTRIHRLSR